MKKKQWVLILSLSAFVSQMAWATTFYVDNQLPGSDGNSGTAETAPFLTVGKCLATLTASNTPGDTCLVKNGTYHESLSLEATVTGSAGSPISLKNFPGHSPVLDCTGILDNCINFNDGDIPSHLLSYFVFQGFEVKGATYAGIKFGNVTNFNLLNNYVHDNLEQGILGIAGYIVNIDGNRVRHNGPFNGTNQNHGMYLTGQNYLIINNIVEDNSAYGIQLAGYGPDATRYPGPQYRDFKSSVIANNTVAYNEQRGGIVLYTDGTGTISGNTVENNILYENSQLYDDGASGGGVTFSGANSNEVVRNNVHYATTPGDTRFLPSSFPATCVNCNWSDFFANCINCTVVNNSSTVNPNMVNAPATIPASPDYHLTNGSVAVGFGLNLASLGIATDIGGNPRPASGPWDAGAYEYGASSGGVAAVPAKPSGLKWQ